MKTNVLRCVLLVLCFSFVGCGPSKDLSLRDRRQIVQDMKAETLQKLYDQAPYTEQRIKEAAGYGVFSNANVSVVFVTGGGGYGLVHDNKTGKETYMKMGMGGLGLGLGAKDYRAVLVFNNEAVLKSFVESGWEFGATADAAAKAGAQGGQAGSEGNIKEDIDVYTMTETGLLLQAVITGNKFWQDPDLN